MPSTVATVFTVLAGILAVIAIGIYFFGIPPEAKRKMEEKALKVMGENKASYVVKGKTFFTPRVVPTNSLPTKSSDQISKLPASDQEDVKQLKKGLSNVLGGSLKNPLGEKAGDAGDEVTKPVTGR